MRLDTLKDDLSIAKCGPNTRGSGENQREFWTLKRGVWNVLLLAIK